MRGLINFKRITCAFEYTVIAVKGYLAVNLVAFNFLQDLPKANLKSKLFSTDLTLSDKSLNGHQKTCKGLQIIIS